MCFILTGFLPHNLNHATLFKLVTGKDPSAEFVTKSYLSCLNNRENQIINTALKSQSYDGVLQVQLAELFSGTQLSVMPSPASLSLC